MKTIRGSLGGSPRSNFFSFQDIIMSVTGILIVIALILALQIDRIPKGAEKGNVSSDSDPTAAGRGELNELEVALAGLKEHLEELQSTSRNAESKAEIKTEISRLEDRISGIPTSHANTGSTLPFDSASIENIKHRAVEIVRLREEIRSDEEAISGSAAAATHANRRLLELENQVKGIEGKVVEARTRNRKLHLIRELSDTTKEPIIVDVSGNSLKFMRFDKPGVVEIQQFANLSTQIKAFKKQDQYFVLYFRPSGACRFEELRQAMKNTGFEIGYEAIEENAVLALGAGGDQ